MTFVDSNRQRHWAVGEIGQVCVVVSGGGGGGGGAELLTWIIIHCRFRHAHHETKDWLPRVSGLDGREGAIVSLKTVENVVSRSN